MHSGTARRSGTLHETYAEWIRRGSGLVQRYDAVIIGGGSLSGGKGTVIGTIAGAGIMTVIQIGCSQHGLPNWVQEIVTGTIIVFAVALDHLRQSHNLPIFQSSNADH